jgi:hypothetical protein
MEIPGHFSAEIYSLAAELPLLNLAAMEYGLVLPRQLRSGIPVAFRPGMWRPHIDLALELKGQGRDWAHLSEIGLRLGLPTELFIGKADIEQPKSAKEWRSMRERVSMDCVLTAIIALSFWRANGRIAVDQTALLHNISNWCVGNLQVAETHTKPLAKPRMDMLDRMYHQTEMV